MQEPVVDMVLDRFFKRNWLKGTSVVESRADQRTAAASGMASG